jgi:adenine phosphoribosyltransferase
MKHSQYLTTLQAAALGDHIPAYPDFPKPGILFRDVSPLLADPRRFEVIVAGLCAPYEQGDQEIPDRVVGIEARGFLFGVAMATRLRRGFVPVRKAGKLPGPTTRLHCDLEYGDADLEIQDGVLGSKDRVVIVDDLLATGGTADAAAALVRQTGAAVLGFDFVIELETLAGRAQLGKDDPKAVVNALFTY